MYVDFFTNVGIKSDMRLLNAVDKFNQMGFLVNCIGSCVPHTKC